MLKRLAAFGTLASLALFGTAHASASRFWPNDVRSVFAIAKSENRNEIHYGIHLDKDCMPVGNEPIYGYWRQLEDGPNVIEDLNALDRTVYGIKQQTVLKRSPEESKVLMSLRAASDRGIAVLTRKRDGKCTVEPIATINGGPARLNQIFVHIAGLFSVDWVELRGAVNGTPVVERVKR